MCIIDYALRVKYYISGVTETFYQKDGWNNTPIVLVKTKIGTLEAVSTFDKFRNYTYQTKVSVIQERGLFTNKVYNCYLLNKE